MAKINFHSRKIVENPLKDPLKNPMKRIYEEFWVPVFGRVLSLFSFLIEGETPKQKQTYNLRDDSEH